MMLFDDLCYLQNHKTGSTFVEQFLRTYCRQPLRYYAKHHSIEEKLPGVFYFTNVRDPLATYRSLFAYGLTGQGEMFERMEHHGLGHLYTDEPGAFGAWLDFVLQAQNAPILSAAYNSNIARYFGLASWRFVRLACPGMEAWGICEGSQEAVERYLEENYGLDAVIRQEELREDLKALVRGPLARAIDRPDEAIAWIDNHPLINETGAGDRLADEPISPALMQRVRTADALLYANFYPRMDLVA